METSRLTANMKYKNMQNNAYANKNSLAIMEGDCFDLSLFSSSFFLNLIYKLSCILKQTLFWNGK